MSSRRIKNYHMKMPVLDRIAGALSLLLLICQLADPSGLNYES
jgi:hypothetical protein